MENLAEIVSKSGTKLGDKLLKISSVGREKLTLLGQSLRMVTRHTLCLSSASALPLTWKVPKLYKGKGLALWLAKAVTSISKASAEPLVPQRVWSAVLRAVFCSKVPV